MKIAGAPISWGVCEVPGWGHQLSAERVLREMHEVGLTATEYGPAGFLPPDPGPLLARYELSALGGFVPVVLHEAASPSSIVDAFPGDVLVLAAATGRDGYDERPALDGAGWRRLLSTLDEFHDLAVSRGIRAVLHPHVGTMIETGPEVERVLEGSRIPLCLDTGHLLIGGTDPAVLAAHAADRIAHVHAKDVDHSMARKVRAGDLTYTEAVARNMYRPIGDGDVDFAAVAAALGKQGYDGWWVLEQDTILHDEPAGEGPVADVRRSAEALRALGYQV
ncbi:TIM barrel protein [Actinoplanes sp. NPDC051633]|uniref:TIM barrel protein n=1 Tax=Actinoplanes sp. NPDC051633 TaxID=3155670 RepID=UPI00343DAFB6